MTTRMSRLPKRMSKALLKDVMVVETALPIVVYVSSSSSWTLFPRCVVAFRARFPEWKQNKNPGTCCRAHPVLTKRRYATTHTNARSEKRRKTERNKSSRDKKVMTKEEKVSFFFFLSCVCWCKNCSKVQNSSRVSHYDIFSKGHLIRYLTTSRAHQSLVFPLRFTGFLVFLRVVLRQVLVVQNF